MPAIPGASSSLPTPSIWVVDLRSGKTGGEGFGGGLRRADELELGTSLCSPP